VRSGFCCPGESNGLRPRSAKRRVFGGGFRERFFWCLAIALLCLASFLSLAPCAEPLAASDVSSGDEALDAITGNPAAENQLPGTGLAGRLIHLPEDSGLRLGGLWLADTNGLLSGGAQPGKWSCSSQGNCPGF
jgi:carbohydrate-selective porin OprB